MCGVSQVNSRFRVLVSSCRKAKRRRRNNMAVARRRRVSTLFGRCAFAAAWRTSARDSCAPKMTIRVQRALRLSCTPWRPIGRQHLRCARRCLCLIVHWPLQWFLSFLRFNGVPTNYSLTITRSFVILPSTSVASSLCVAAK